MAVGRLPWEYCNGCGADGKTIDSWKYSTLALSRKNKNAGADADAKDTPVPGHPGGGAGLLAIAAAGGDPLAPFVVGDERGGYEDDGENAEEDFHGWFRIA